MERRERERLLKLYGPYTDRHPRLQMYPVSHFPHTHSENLF